MRFRVTWPRLQRYVVQCNSYAMKLKCLYVTQRNAGPHGAGALAEEAADLRRQVARLQGEADNKVPAVVVAVCCMYLICWSLFSGRRSGECSRSA